MERSGGLGGCVASSTRSTPIHPSIQAIQSIPCLMPMPMPSSVERCKDERGGRGERAPDGGGGRAGGLAAAAAAQGAQPSSTGEVVVVEACTRRVRRLRCFQGCCGPPVCGAVSPLDGLPEDPHVSGLGRLVQIADLGRSNRGHHPPCRCLPRHLPNCAASKIHAPSRPLPRGPWATPRKGGWGRRRRRCCCGLSAGGGPHAPQNAPIPPSVSSKTVRQRLAPAPALALQPPATPTGKAGTLYPYSRTAGGVYGTVTGGAAGSDCRQNGAADKPDKPLTSTAGDGTAGACCAVLSARARTHNQPPLRTTSQTSTTCHRHPTPDRTNGRANPPMSARSPRRTHAST